MRNNVYDDVKTIGGGSFKPQSVSGSAAVNGASVDTLGADSAAIYVYAVAATGSPSPASLAVSLQESLDGSTNWTAALDNTGAVIGFTLAPTSADKEGMARVEGLNLNRQRYLRVVVTPTFTGGSSPASVVFGQILLGNTTTLPVNTTASNT